MRAIGLIQNILQGQIEGKTRSEPMACAQCEVRIPGRTAWRDPLRVIPISGAEMVGGTGNRHR